MLENSMRIAGTYNAEASKRMKTGVMTLANNMHTINRHSSEPTLLGFRRRIRSTRPTIGKPIRNVSSQIVINAQVRSPRTGRSQHGEPGVDGQTACGAQAGRAAALKVDRHARQPERSGIAPTTDGGFRAPGDSEGLSGPAVLKLSAYDCQICEAGNGEEGLAAAAREKPDLIILDVTRRDSPRPGRMGRAEVTDVITADDNLIVVIKAYALELLGAVGEELNPLKRRRSGA